MSDYCPANVFPINMPAPVIPPDKHQESDPRAKLLAAWLEWAIMGHNNGPEHVYGNPGAVYMRRLLKGEDVPMPPKLRG